jgi:hypothetical protein
MENADESGTPSLTQETITTPCSKFENGRTMQNVNNSNLEDLAVQHVIKLL